MDTETKHWVIYYVTIVNNEFKGLSLYPQHYKRRGNAVLTAQKMFDGNKDATVQRFWWVQPANERISFSCERR
nr:MAG TPA: hypothetical protein [Caudoviricetes sp.]